MKLLLSYFSRLPLWKKSILLFPFVWFAVHQVIIVSDGLTDEPQKSAYAVVFGNTVNVDGSLSERLQARVKKGMALYQDSIVDKIFVSGGLGKEGHYEGTKMAEFLVANGIPKSDIVIDNQGNNTWMTAVNFRSAAPNAHSVIVVSQYYHITRAKLAFVKSGVNTVHGVHADYFEPRDLYSLLREFAGYYKYLLVY